MAATVIVTIDRLGDGRFGAKSGQALEVTDALRRAGFDARLVDVNEEPDLRWPAESRVVFVCVAEEFPAGPAAGRFPGPFGVRRLLEHYGLAFLGSPAVVCATTSSGDKRLARAALTGVVDLPDGLDIDGAIDVESAADRIVAELGVPVVIKKATKGGCSVGVHFADNRDSIVQALRSLGPSATVVEAFVVGTELTVWLTQLAGDSALAVLGGMEIEKPVGQAILSRSAKRLARPKAPRLRGLAPDWPELHVPPRIDATRLREAESAALRAANALNVRGYCRVDLIVDGKRSFVIDVNATPHLSAAGLGLVAATRGSSYELILADMVAAVELRR